MPESFVPGTPGFGMDPYARQMALAAQQTAESAQAASVAAQGVAGSAQLAYRHGATSGLALKVYTTSGVTSGSGAASFVLPSGFFNVVTWVGPTVIRDSASPTTATFAQVRSVTTVSGVTTVVVQCWESKTTGVLILNTQVEGLEAVSTAGIVVQLAVYGY